MTWAAARRRYETSDCTQSELAEELGVTRQAVCNRAKKEGWLKFTGVDIAESPLVPPVSTALGKYSDENISTIIDTYALTGNKAMACRQVGIDDKTLANWCQAEPEISVTMRAAREQHLIGQYRKIADAKDWKAAKEILARAPETREQWGENRESGPTIILNIHRDEVVIEGQ